MLSQALRKMLIDRVNAPSVAQDFLSAVLPDGDRQAVRNLTLRCQLLHDGYGKVQVILPQAGILDLERLNLELNRELCAMSPQECERFAQTAGCVVPPALPVFRNLDLVVDAAVLDWDRASFLTSDPRNPVVVEASPYRNLLEAAGARYADVSIRLPRIAVNHNRPDEDLEQIRSAILSFTSLRIQKRLEDTLEMPPLPDTARRIIRMRVNPGAGVQELADIVETDPSLAAQVVSWASSSFYAAPGKIKSVKDAIMRVLGFDLVMNLAMGLSLGRMLKLPEDHSGELVPYWEQAVWSATLSGALCSIMPKENRPEFGLTYLAGLLHNYGYLILAHVFPPHFIKTCRLIEVNPHVDAENCEQHLLGITREQIGAQLMALWSLPEEVVTAIRYQKNPFYNGDHAAYVQLLFLTTQLLRNSGLSSGPVQPVPQSTWNVLGLDREAAEAVLEELQGMSGEMQALARSMQG